MTKSEMKKWIVAIGLVALSAGGYMWYNSQQAVPVDTPYKEAPQVGGTNKDTQNNAKDNDNVKKESPKNQGPAFGITKAMKDEHVTIQGYITNITSGKGHIFPVVKDPKTGKSIKAVIFAPKKDKEKAEVNERQHFVEQRRKDGKLVTIEGKVSVYNDELDVIINKVY